MISFSATPPADRRVDADFVARALRLEARALRGALMEHRILRMLINGERDPSVTRDEVGDAYVRLLRMSMDYVQWTVQALLAASVSLSGAAEEEDRSWAGRMTDYARDKMDDVTGRGHDAWARADLIHLGATELADAPAHPAAAEYHWYFVARAGAHPYAVLGAKSVLEELSVRVASPILAGIRAFGIVPASGDDAGARFVHQHGDLDVEHGRQGARDLRDLKHARQRHQVLEGAYVTTGVYRQLAHHYLG